MKRVSALFAMIFIIGCSNSNDSGSNNNAPTTYNKVLHPPSWIQGTWKYISANGTVQYNGFTFYKDWFAKYTTSVVGYQSGDYRVNEQITDTSYRVEFFSGETNSTVFLFTKVTDTKIKWENPDSNQIGLNIYTKRP